MRAVVRQDILDLTAYEKARPEQRARVIEEKRRRRVHLGEELTFLFENHDTVLYQIQEMLRAERIVQEREIAHEIETYNELVGGPGELGCALLIEIVDPEVRDRKLREWLALPQHLYVKLADGRKVRARFDARQVGADRLSSVQYMRFDTQGQVPVAVGSDLPALTLEQALSDEQHRALVADLAD
jgi:hypothetical protein